MPMMQKAPAGRSGGSLESATKAENDAGRKYSSSGEKASRDRAEAIYQANRSGKLMLGKVVLAEQQKRSRLDWKPSRELMRLREIETVIRDRHGPFIPDPEDTDDRDFCLAYARAAILSLSAQCGFEWAAKWLPWARRAEIEPFFREAATRKHMMNSDGVAGLLCVTFDERTRLGLKTIGACDLSKADRKKLAKQRKRERDRERMRAKRAAEPRKNRRSYEAESIETLKPWIEEGISRRTWYRRRGTSVSRIDIYSNGDIPVPNGVAPIPPCPPSSHQRTVREADRERGPGNASPAGLQGAEPHGTDDRKGKAA